jgi:hypothetical protein
MSASARRDPRSACPDAGIVLSKMAAIGTLERRIAVLYAELDPKALLGSRYR